MPNRHIPNSALCGDNQCSRNGCRGTWCHLTSWSAKPRSRDCGTPMNRGRSRCATDTLLSQQFHAQHSHRVNRLIFMRSIFLHRQTAIVVHGSSQDIHTRWKTRAGRQPQSRGSRFRPKLRPSCWTRTFYFTIRNRSSSSRITTSPFPWRCSRSSMPSRGSSRPSGAAMRGGCIASCRGCCPTRGRCTRASSSITAARFPSSSIPT